MYDLTYMNYLEKRLTHREREWIREDYQKFAELLLNDYRTSIGGDREVLETDGHDHTTVLM